MTPTNDNTSITIAKTKPTSPNGTATHPIDPGWQAAASARNHWVEESLAKPDT